MNISIISTLLPAFALFAAEGQERWNEKSAAAYLDERAREWFSFPAAARGENETQTVCISCHTMAPYVFARPVLRRRGRAAEPTSFEQKLLAQTQQRVENWKELDTKKFALLYDSNEKKKAESWGTEAVWNALILALDDRNAGRSTPSGATRKAFDNLWQVQAQDGPQRGSWDWLDFHYEPWESGSGRYFGAALAAIAVGTAPGYYRPGSDTALDANVGRLRDYLKNGLAAQNLHHRIWGLWASTQLDQVLTATEQKSVIEELLSRQRPDGGWSLAALGGYVRRDGSPQVEGSDGYATGLVLHVLQLAGAGADDRVARGLAWLRAHQTAAGSWPATSVNKKRDPASQPGKFMADAATGYAVLALSH